MTETADGFHPVVADSDLPGHRPIPFVVQGWPLVLCRIEGGIHALIDRCTHALAPMSHGRIRRGSITCPLHGARYDIATGKCLGGPFRPLQTFPVRVVDGWIEVKVPEQLPEQGFS